MNDEQDRLLPEVRALVRLLDRGAVELPSAFAFDDSMSSAWQDVFGPSLSSREWSGVLGTLAGLLLVHTNAGGMHVIFGLTPLGSQVAKAVKANIPAGWLSPLTGAVFLSHSHKDNEFCYKLNFDLRNRDIRTWFDLDDFNAGDSIPAKIDAAMRESEYVVVVYSSSSATSRWVKLEYDTAINLEMSGQLKRVIVVKIDETPLPPILAHKQYIRFLSDDRYGKEYEESFHRLLRSLAAG